MILVDTSVWIDHLYDGNPQLESLLDEGEVVCHPFIIGELACGNILNRTKILAYLRSLPQAGVAGQDEVMSLIEAHRLMGIGLGFVDVHLLASARLSMIPLWTRDIQLKKAAAELDVLFP
ncbi:MAG: ribonuclease [Candidatus Aminicenantes bacterium RBG_19FT_COMBO_58_17]|nr:MAG: ribonuclease [Candidatus Aminicenantes bacterium RBG_19FT_COMBO_58_17]